MSTGAITPNRLPDGSVVWERRGEAKAVLDALEEYDPACTLIRNFTRVHPDTGVVGCWEIWRADESGAVGRVGSFWGDRLPAPMQVVADLAAHDTWRGYDPVADYIARQEAARKEADDALEDKFAEHADRMHYEFVDEFKNHMPAARPIYLGESGDRRPIHTKEAREKGLL